MCGIIGYVGSQPALPILLDGLTRLQYRGYDSAGVALLDDNRLNVCKTEGDVETLRRRVAAPRQPRSTGGIAHTRWATHGRPSDANAHPHLDCHGAVAVVHNGIIENHAVLRRALEAAGHRFRSETDTEVVAHLIEDELGPGGDLRQAVMRATGRLEGAYALVVGFRDRPDLLIGSRFRSSLVAGAGADAGWLASDLTALVGHLAGAVVLEDGELVEVAPGSVALYDAGGRRLRRDPVPIPWSPGHVGLDGYAHFMLKEIHEQPAALERTVANRLGPGAPVLAEAGLTDAAVQRLEAVHFTGCGTAFHAANVGRRLLHRFGRLYTYEEVASEYRYAPPPITRHTLLLAVSQSGETADTLGAVRLARERGARVLAVTNVASSTLAREADHVVLTHAGPELAVASTKAYTAQVALLSLLAAELAAVRGERPPRAAPWRCAFEELPAQVENLLEESDVDAAAERLAGAASSFFIGRDLDLPTAREGQLKLKEISYRHAEAYAAGELKHGALALVEPGVPVVLVATQRELLGKMAATRDEIAARGGCIVAVTWEGESALSRSSDQILALPRADERVAPVLAAVPLQLLAYEAARRLDLPIDRPRNLAKSVTVE